jgi:hypothetical protein
MDMLPQPIRYQFTQPFLVSAKEAFDWCTDFTPKDPQLMGNENAQRTIIPIADGVTLLKDLYQTSAGTVEKQKLVLTYPNQLTWTSTHLCGPNKHSQFLYTITPQGTEASMLTFTALHLENDQTSDPRLLAERLCKQDAAVWERLAKALEKERQNIQSS